jgi:hypothetical protein
MCFWVENNMKIRMLIGAAALSVVLLSSLSVAARSQGVTDEKSQIPHVEDGQIDKLNFRVGNKFFHARSEENGLYREVCNRLIVGNRGLDHDGQALAFGRDAFDYVR